ncbi:AraC family transcriptional regulator [Nocardioides sp. MH1]|uniref:helix-turn-helix transcriptional regulator n=1 Tax=Nocardioides sp. MH1 TaxID=3242490 RepID=UPI003521EAE8
MSTRFVTTDPDVGSARVAELYADNRLRVRGERDSFRFEQSRDDIGEVRFDRFANSLVTDYTVDPLGHVLIARIVEHQMEIWTDGTHRVLGPGDVALIAHPDRDYSTRLHGASMQLIGVDTSLLDAVAGGAAWRDRLRYETLDPAQVAKWHRTIDYVTTTVLDESLRDSALVLGSAGRHLAAVLLASFGVSGADTATQATALPSVVRRAVAFCDESPDLDIGVADIARTCNVSVRTLQVAFRRHLDTTPMAYLRQVRLDRVRADLVAADPSRTTISRIAARWGFADPSRFTASYRAAYDEYPSETLRRS